MSKHRDRVLLLRRTPFGESSLVVHGLGRGTGRVHLIAKGAYRPTSGFAHLLDLVDSLELEWRQRPEQSLGTLVSGRLDRRRRHVSSSTDAWAAATTAIELTELAARPGDPDPGLFDLLEGFLDELDARAASASQDEGDAQYHRLALAIFELRFLAQLGLFPALARCAACGEDAPPIAGPRAAFSSGAGGRLCRAHAEEARASGRRVGTLPAEVLETAARWSARPFRRTLEEAPPPGLVVRVLDFVGRFLDYHLETRPKSHRAFLSRPDRNRAGTGEIGAPRG